MLFEQIVFFFAAAGALAGALGVVVLKNPFYAVLALIVHLLSLATLFLLLQAQFLAAAQVIVYAGAVMVLYVFVVAYIGGSDEPVRPASGAASQLGPIFAVALLIEIAIAVIGSGLQALDTRGAKLGAAFGDPGQIGELLLQKFLLLVASVGAVVLARRRRGLEYADAEEREAGGEGSA